MSRKTWLPGKSFVFGRLESGFSLSAEASEILKTFYLRLRENNDSASSIAITTRQLESLIRLSQARAKLEMRTEVTKEDALVIAFP